jgi:hypothetical protein
MSGQVQGWVHDASLPSYTDSKMNAVYNADSMAFLALGLCFDQTEWHEEFALPCSN